MRTFLRRFFLALAVLPVSVLFAGAAGGRVDAGERSLASCAQGAALNPIQIENSNPGTPGWDEFASIGTSTSSTWG